MTTAKAIEGMKDAGEFEILALRVLRINDDDCKFLIHYGVNENGKTIKNPLDGFCLVPDSTPPRYVMAAFATNEVTSLEKKWIYDHTLSPRSKKARPSDDGDLIKASKQAEKIRKDFPNAKFVLHLCTNRIPDSKWLPNVYKKGADLGIEINILEQSRLRDCLDTTPDGQWLRKQHLGIDADLLSQSLLNNLSKLNQDRYSQEFFITPTTNFIATENKKRIYEYLEKMTEKTIHVLLGKSGSGKSVTSYQIINELLEKNRLAIRIHGEIVSRSLSLEEAIDSTLRAIHPTIQKDSGKVALSYSTVENPFIIVIDDINRNYNPSETIRRILSWSNPCSDKQNNKSWERKWTIILPTWDIHWESHEESFKSATWINLVLVEKMEISEAISFLKNSLSEDIQINESDLYKIVDELNYDPILLAMFSVLLNSNPSGNPSTVVIKVFSEFSKSMLKEVAIQNKYLLEDYESILREVAKYMLINRDLYPSWSIVSEWLSPNQIEILRQLVKNGKVCEIRNNLSDTQFSFRHDRILEYYLAIELSDFLNNYTSNDDILTDPFYYHFISRALTLKEYSLQLIEWLKIHNPLSLVASIRYLDPMHLSSYDKEIVNAASNIIITVLMQNRSQISYINKTIRVLESIDSPIILEVTNSIKNKPIISFARLANGDPFSGILQFIRDDTFLPNTNYQYLENILIRAKKNHFPSLISGCKDLLVRPSLDKSLRIASLTLAGYLGTSELENSIKICWDNDEIKNDILIPALWAALRCSKNNLDELLSPMLHQWSLLSDKNDNGVYSDRVEIAEELRFAMRHGISEKVLTYLTDTAYKSESLRFVVAYLLEHVDHPIAVTYVVEAAAELNNNAHKSGGFSHWALMLYHDYSNYSSKSNLISNDSSSAIKRIWDSPTNDDWLRKESFFIWTKVNNNLDELKMIQPNHPQFDSVVLKRAQLGDSSVVPHVINLLQKKSYYFRFINHIWCKDFFEIIDTALIRIKDTIPIDYSGGRTDEEYFLAESLRDISVENAELLLCKNFDHLKYSSLFIQAALYIGTTKCLDLAKQAIIGYPSEVNPLQHVGNFFGFMTINLMEKLSQKHVIALVPYLSYLSSVDLMEIVEYCIKNNLYNWMRIYLSPELERRFKLENVDSTLQRMKLEYFPTDDELISELDRIEKENHSDYHIYKWCENFYKRNEQPHRWKNILENWMGKSPSISRLEIFGTALSRFGDRLDLGLLTKYQIIGETQKINDLLNNVRFSVMMRTLR